jgi:hypothetical protein
MSLAALRAQMTAYRASVDERGKYRRDSYFALERLHTYYQKLEPAERMLAAQVLAEWATADDEAVRFDAAALIRDFKIVDAKPALERLAQRLECSTNPGAPFELEKVKQIIDHLA